MNNLIAYVPRKNYSAEQLTDYQEQLQEAIANPLVCIQLIVNDLTFIVSLIKDVQKLRSFGVTRIDVIDACDLSDHEKICRALMLAGAAGIHLMERKHEDVPETNEQDFSATQEPFVRDCFPENHPVPQDFVTFQDYSLNGVRLKEAVIRINYVCNESCLFCWIYQDQPPVSYETITCIIQKLAEQNVHILSFSGGEPTLDSSLPKLIAFAKSLGIEHVMVQTNGVLLASKRQVQTLVESGLDAVFLALHSHDATLSEQITGLKGSHKKSVQALRHLLAEKLDVFVNIVINRLNVETLPDFATFLTNETARAGRTITLNLAVAAPLGEYEKRYAEFTPTIRELRGPVQALTKIVGACPHIILDGFDSACGMPLCVLEQNVRHIHRLPETVENDTMTDFVKGEVCHACRMSARCYGIRKEYKDHYGTDELIPFRS